MATPARTQATCGYFRAATGHCGAVEGVRRYLTGPRCPAHTPSALAGRPEPGAAAYCPPAACWCGECPGASPIRSDLTHGG